jgi:stress-induced morphogen
MPVKSRGTSHKTLAHLAKALNKYLEEHEDADIELYRQNSASVRIRIIDTGFEGVSRSDRHNLVWSFLDDLPDGVLGQVTVLPFLTPAEKENSFASFEFDDPVPSQL